jgi:hypothetical protein
MTAIPAVATLAIFLPFDCLLGWKRVGVLEARGACTL